MRRDAIAGLAVAAASLFLFWLTLGLEKSALVPVGPGFYPRIVLGVTIALSLWLVISGLWTKQDKAPKKERLNYALVALQFGIFGLYVGALPFLGFRLATALYTAAANATLDPPRGARGWGRVLLLAVLTAFLSHLVFERYLQVLLPRGSWTGF
ncbi:MAG: tripartite tricarboxylate transporter TctB family protein [Burkholderiales bacterium]|nr:tripartite tricarboxylate transporter TctB family protein [Burkholderiales bacterium]